MRCILCSLLQRRISFCIQYFLEIFDAPIRLSASRRTLQCENAIRRSIIHPQIYNTRYCERQSCNSFGTEMPTDWRQLVHQKKNVTKIYFDRLSGFNLTGLPPYSASARPICTRSFSGLQRHFFSNVVSTAA